MLTFVFYPWFKKYYSKILSLVYIYQSRISRKTFKIGLAISRDFKSARFCQAYYRDDGFYPKVVLIWELAPRQIFKLFPANIWIFKFFFLMILAIKIILDYTYGLLNILEFFI